jgi:TonB-dependent Receptor Plug Domain
MSSAHHGIASAVFFLCLTTGCAHSKYHDLSGGSPDVITEDDIARVHAQTAYDAVTRLRANFLTRRGSTSVLNTSDPEPNVYLDDVFIGAVAQLRGIQASDVASIRVYRAWEVAARFGNGNLGGVIEVYTKH